MICLYLGAMRFDPRDFCLVQLPAVSWSFYGVKLTPKSTQLGEVI